MSASRIIPVFFTGNRKYLPHICVAVRQIMKHAAENDVYHFHLLTADDVGKKEKKRFLGNLPQTRHHVFFDMVEDKFPKEAVCSSSSWSRTVYYRLLIPFLPYEYDKVIFLDGDITVHENLASLYEIDLGENLMGMVPDEVMEYFRKNNQKLGPNDYWEGTYTEYCKKEIGNPPCYFIAAMQLMNLKKIRESAMDLYREMLRETSHGYLLQDQDLLNKYLAGRILRLDNRFLANTLPSGMLRAAASWGVDVSVRTPCISHGKFFRMLPDCDSESYWNTLRETDYFFDIQGELASEFLLYALHKKRRPDRTTFLSAFLALAFSVLWASIGKLRARKRK